MTKKEKDFKNDILDILNDYQTIISILNTGEALYSKESLKEELRKMKEYIRLFRDVTITME